MIDITLKPVGEWRKDIKKFDFDLLWVETGLYIKIFCSYCNRQMGEYNASFPLKTGTKISKYDKIFNEDFAVYDTRKDELIKDIIEQVTAYIVAENKDYELVKDLIVMALDDEPLKFKE